MKNHTVRFFLVLVFFLVFVRESVAKDAEDLLVINSPKHSVKIVLRKIRYTNDGKRQTTYFYFVHTPGTFPTQVFLTSAFEDSVDGEKTDFGKFVNVKWSNTECSFILQEHVPADSPCGKFHLITNLFNNPTPKFIGSGPEEIPLNFDPPARFLKKVKANPMQFGWPYSVMPQNSSIEKIDDEEVRINFNCYVRTYRFKDHGTPKD